jgi:hypothetical protein
MTTTDNSLDEDVIHAKRQIIMAAVGLFGLAVGTTVFVETATSVLESIGSAEEIGEAIEGALGSVGFAMVVGGLPVIGFLFGRRAIGKLAMLLWLPIAAWTLGPPLASWVDQLNNPPPPAVVQAPVVVAPAPVVIDPTPAPKPVIAPVVIKPARPTRSIKILKTELANAIAMVGRDEWWETSSCTSEHYQHSAACQRVQTLRDEIYDLEHDDKTAKAVPVQVSETVRPAPQVVAAPKPHKPRKPRSAGSIVLARLTQLLGPGFCVAALMAALAEIQADAAALKAKNKAKAGGGVELGVGPTAVKADPKKELRSWATNNLHSAPGVSTGMTELFNDYLGWCNRTGAAPMSPLDYVDGLNEILMTVRGVTVDQANGVVIGAKLGA